MGYSFAAGTTDGPGSFAFEQGTTTSNPFWNTVRNFLAKPTDEDIRCHDAKPILLATGRVSILCFFLLFFSIFLLIHDYCRHDKFQELLERRTISCKTLYRYIRQCIKLYIGYYVFVAHARQKNTSVCDNKNFTLLR